MKTPWFNVFLGFVLLAVMLAAGYFVLARVLGFFSSADANVQASIVAGFFALSAAIGSWYYQNRKSQLERHKEKKVEIYSEIMGVLNEVLKRSKKGPEEIEEYLSSEEIYNFFWEMNKNLVLWGSSGVVRAYYDAFKTPENSDSTVRLAGVEKFYLEIRKDLGLSNRGLKQYDLIGIMVNDIDTLRTGKIQK